MRQAQALLDRDGTFAAIQRRAKEFGWDAEMQARANAWASRQMVGWIEEVHKGLEGLQRVSSDSDPAEKRETIGRLLQARFGLSWGLSRVMQVQRGVLVSGDNAFYDQVAEAIGPDSLWVDLRRQAFGIDHNIVEQKSPALADQIKAGLQLYVVTAELLGDALLAQDKPLIQETVELIDEVIGPVTT